MNKFKVGDLVRGTASRYSITNENMTKGKVVKVNSTSDRLGVIVLEHKIKGFEGERLFYVDAERFELVVESKPRIIKVGKAKFIFNPPYTIVTDGTHTGKAKCNPADEYDPITGLEIAKKRFEEAKFPDKSGELLKEVKKLVKPEFRVGDRVEMINARGYSFDKVGNTGTVVFVSAGNLAQITVDGYFNPHGENGWNYLNASEQWKKLCTR